MKLQCDKGWREKARLQQHELCAVSPAPQSKGGISVVGGLMIICREQMGGNHTSTISNEVPKAVSDIVRHIFYVLSIL